jgi:hypothetical protein
MIHRQAVIHHNLAAGGTGMLGHEPQPSETGA